jgi:hypothetical protein
VALSPIAYVAKEYQLMRGESNIRELMSMPRENFRFSATQKFPVLRPWI